MPAGRPRKVPDTTTIRVLRGGGWLMKQIALHFRVSDRQLRQALKSDFENQGLGISSASFRCGGESSSANLPALVIESVQDATANAASLSTGNPSRSPVR